MTVHTHMLYEQGFRLKQPVAKADSQRMVSLASRSAARGGAAHGLRAPIIGLGALVAGLVLLLTSGGDSPGRSIAEGINLRPGDLPGFVTQTDARDESAAQLDAKLKRCLGGWSGQRDGAGDVGSPSFVSGGGLQAEEVQSGVTVQSSRSLVSTDLALMRVGGWQSCLTASLDGWTFPTSSGVPVTVNSAQLQSLPTAAQGADGSFGFRALMTVEALGGAIPLRLDVFGYAVGHDELGLLTFAVGRTFPDQTEQRLSRLLVDRALARPH